MRLNGGEGNGVSLAGRTSQSISRIDRTVVNLAICRTFSRAVLLLVIARQGMVTDRQGPLPTSLESTVHLSTARKFAVERLFYGPSDHRGRCGRYFTSSFPMVCIVG
jgi:hypothetical protein